MKKERLGELREKRLAYGSSNEERVLEALLDRVDEPSAMANASLDYESSVEKGKHPGQLWDAALAKLKDSAPALAKVVVEALDVQDPTYWPERAMVFLAEKSRDGEGIKDMDRAKQQIN